MSQLTLKLFIKSDLLIVSCIATLALLIGGYGCKASSLSAYIIQYYRFYKIGIYNIKVYQPFINKDKKYSLAKISTILHLVTGIVHSNRKLGAYKHKFIKF